LRRCHGGQGGGEAALAVQAGLWLRRFAAGALPQT